MLSSGMAFSTSEDMIAAAEEALQRRFPPALRSRFARANGGEIGAIDEDWTLNPVRDASDRKRLARTTSDVVHETAAARTWQRFPPDGIAVASNGGGDLLVLLPANYGKLR